MSEVIPIRRVVELRYDLIPSDQLRDILVGFLDSDLDSKTKQSLQAAMLFKSYRRRIIDSETYYRHEMDSTVRDASIRFNALPRRPVLLDGGVGVGYNHKVGRIFVRSRKKDSVSEANEILESIPTIDHKSETSAEILDQIDRFYIELPKSSIASPFQVEQASRDLHQRAIHPSMARNFYLTLDKIVTREMMSSFPPESTETEQKT